MSFIEHAKKEFELAGWTKEPVDEMQQMVMDNLLELLETFSNQGHSGFSASYVLGCFLRLSKFETLTELTGEDDEWSEIGDGTKNGDVMYQNKRESAVFKNGKDSEAYWLDGNIFRNQHGSTFTNEYSLVPVKFPWVKPESNYVDVFEKEEKDERGVGTDFDTSSCEQAVAYNDNEPSKSVPMDSLFETFNNLQNDEARWKWLIVNQDKGIIVNCDNDDTFITTPDDEDDEDYASFDNYVGWSDGVFDLLKAIGIEAESV